MYRRTEVRRTCREWSLPFGGGRRWDRRPLEWGSSDLHRPPRLGSSKRGTSDPQGKRVLHVATPLVTHACSRLRQSLRAVSGLSDRWLLWCGGSYTRPDWHVRQGLSARSPCISGLDMRRPSFLHFIPIKKKREWFFFSAHRVWPLFQHDDGQCSSLKSTKNRFRLHCHPEMSLLVETRLILHEDLHALRFKILTREIFSVFVKKLMRFFYTIL